jgi:hypothetical protein
MILLTAADLIAIHRSGRTASLSEKMRSCRCDAELDAFVAYARAAGRWDEDREAPATRAMVRREIARLAALKSNRGGLSG